MRVLLVEDDPATSRSIELMLTHANLNVYCTDLGEEGIDLAKLYDYDLILLDLNLPDMNGHEVLRQLRLARVETPILILSGSDDSENKLKGFGFGADDYMTKPFHREELVARIHAIIRRSKGHAQSVIRTGEINVNLDAKTVDVNGEMVHLTGKEYQMLELLSLRKGTTLTKEGTSDQRLRHRRHCGLRVLATLLSGNGRRFCGFGTAFAVERPISGRLVLTPSAFAGPGTGCRGRTM